MSVYKVYEYKVLADYGAHTAEQAMRELGLQGWRQISSTPGPDGGLTVTMEREWQEGNCCVCSKPGPVTAQRVMIGTTGRAGDKRDKIGPVCAACIVGSAGSTGKQETGREPSLPSWDWNVR